VHGDPHAHKGVKGEELEKGWVHNIDEGACARHTYESTEEARDEVNVVHKGDGARHDLVRGHIHRLRTEGTGGGRGDRRGQRQTNEGAFSDRNHDK
jgi:hypothetical protein